MKTKHGGYEVYDFLWRCVIQPMQSAKNFATLALRTSRDGFVLEFEMKLTLFDLEA